MRHGGSAGASRRLGIFAREPNPRCRIRKQGTRDFIRMCLSLSMSEALIFTIYKCCTESIWTSTCQGRGETAGNGCLHRAYLHIIHIISSTHRRRLRHQNPTLPSATYRTRPILLRRYYNDYYNNYDYDSYDDATENSPIPQVDGPSVDGFSRCWL